MMLRKHHDNTDKPGESTMIELVLTLGMADPGNGEPVPTYYQTRHRHAKKSGKYNIWQSCKRRSQIQLL